MSLIAMLVIVCLISLAQGELNSKVFPALSLFSLTGKLFD